MFASPREILVRSHVPQHTTLEISKFCLNFEGKSTVLLNLRINKDLELVLIHFLGVKNVVSNSVGSNFWSPPYMYTGVNRLSLGSNSKGCVRGLKFLKGLF